MGQLKASYLFPIKFPLLNFLGLSCSLEHFQPASLPTTLPLDETVEPTVDSPPLATCSSSVSIVLISLPWH